MAADDIETPSPKPKKADKATPKKSSKKKSPKTSNPKKSSPSKGTSPKKAAEAHETIENSASKKGKRKPDDNTSKEPAPAKKRTRHSDEDKAFAGRAKPKCTGVALDQWRAIRDAFLSKIHLGVVSPSAHQAGKS